MTSPDLVGTAGGMRSRPAQLVELPVQDMLAGLGSAGVNQHDAAGWTALMWACARGRQEHAKALIGAGANPQLESQRVVQEPSGGHYYHAGQDACAIGFKAGNFNESARKLALYMFYILNTDQRLLAALRRLLLASGLEQHMGGGGEGSPLEWLQIELISVAGCVPPASEHKVLNRFCSQGFAWHGKPSKKKQSSLIPAQPGSASGGLISAKGEKDFVSG